MKFTLALAQCAHPKDRDALALVRRWARAAKEQGADLLVFPESLMTPFELTAQEFVTCAEPLDGPFARGVDAIAHELGLWVAYTVNELNPAGGNPYNTLVVTSSEGVQQARYRKVHLFDVGPYRESKKMSAGDALCAPLHTPLCTLGLGICYDLRFPELARAQALGGCELMLYPAAWVDGPNKVNQWQALLAARAVENGMYVAGLSRTGNIYAGHSMVVAPDGGVVAQAGPHEQLLCCTIDTQLVADVRAAVPSLAHRRPELYGR